MQCYNSTPSGEVVETEVEVRETDMTFVPPEDVQLAETGADEAIMLLHPIPPESPTPTVSNLLLYIKAASHKHQNIP